MSDQDVIRIVIPGMPKGAGRARTRVVSPKGGKPFATVYTPAETRTEAGVIRMHAAEAMNGRAPFDGPIDLRMTSYRPIPKSWSKKQQQMARDGLLLPTSKPDYTNIARFEDALKSIVWLDDAQITDAHHWKRFGDIPRVVIEVRRRSLPVSVSS